MKLSVVILNYNVRYFLQLCLQSVTAAIQDLDAEIIVVDNASADASCAMVRELFPKVKVIENKDNLGFSKGNNIGVAQAKGEYVCILNPDTVVAEDTFTTCLKRIQNKKIGILGCKLVDGKGAFLPESKRNVPVVKVALQKMLGQSKAYYSNTITENGEGEIKVLVGAFMVITRHLYMQIGGFDEDYFMYGEDIDLSYSVLNTGVSNYYLGTTSVIHYKGESTLKDATYAKRFYGAMQLFYKKHFKSNLLFDALVFLGIQTARFISKPKIEKVENPSCVILVSNKTYPKLEEKLGVTLKTVQKLTAVVPRTQIIFDANYLSFKSIIKNMEELHKNNEVSFRILPKNANFILGSDSSKTKGEIITF